MSFLYLVTPIVFIVISVIVFLLMKHFKNVLLTNLIFFGIVTICYYLDLLVLYLKNGVDDWNFINVLPIANISPFLFVICPIIFILPKLVKKYFALLISLLSVGMVLSPIISCVYNFSIGYKFHAFFLLNYTAHFVFALWGIYLLQSNQFELKIKDSVISSCLIVGVAIIMMIIDVIFDTSFFGLSLNGKHNIYGMVLVDNSYLSALVYFSGLLIVLVAGYFFQKLLLLIKQKYLK